MAKAIISVSQDNFICSLCLELLRVPVTLHCGHSFCMECINKCWDQEDNKGTFSCPQCRETFTPRPAVSKNFVLADITEKLINTKIQATVAGPEDVECDSCIGKKYKAVKSCLVCLASFCKTHLQPHYKSAAYKKHKLVEASRRLQDQICSQHDKLLEVYCRTDHKCICMLCLLEDHEGHDITSAAAERTKIEEQISMIQKKVQLKIQIEEKELHNISKVLNSYRSSAQISVETIEMICTELLRLIQRRCSEVTELIRDQEKAAVSQAEDVLEQLKQKILELKNKDAELEEFLHSEDSVHFLQSFQSILASTGSTESLALTVDPFLSFDEVIKFVYQLQEKVEKFWKDNIKKIPNQVKKIRIISPLKPKIRGDLLQYFSQFTLDPNTAHKRLYLYKKNKCVISNCTECIQSYPDHPDRFDFFSQVLCSESVCVSVSGRCYWEVQWTGNYGVSIAVSYKSISRKGDGNECLFGYNNQSWSLFCSPSRFSFLHNNKGNEIPIMPSSCRIGVYVDYRAGILSFYNVSDMMKLLHKVQTKFTQLLYPGFSLWPGTEVKLIKCT